MAIEKLYEGNIHKKYILYTIPLVLSALISQSYTLINSMMIGKFIGSEGFAATSVTAPFIELISSIFWGYLSGFAIYAASLFGKNENKKMLDVIKMNFIITSLIAVLISVSCIVWHEQLFDVLNISDDIADLAFSYFSIYISGMIILQFSWGFTYLAHGLGLTSMPLIVSIISGVLNVAGNYLFLGVLHKGIAYCALATIIATSVGCFIYIVKFLKIFQSMNLQMRNSGFDGSELKKSVFFAIPTMLQQMVMYVSTTAVSPLINTCGTAAISGFNIANKAKSLQQQVYQSSNKATTNFIAQAMGAGKIKKVRQGIKVGITQTLAIYLPVMILFVIFAQGFSEAFLDKVKDAESIKYSVTLIRFFVPFLTFNLFNNVFHGIFRATGSGKMMVISTLVYTVALVIYCFTFYYVLTGIPKIYSIYLGFACAWITEALFATIIFLSGKWKTKEYKELEEKERVS